METMKSECWKAYMPEFREKTTAYYAGDITLAEYKGCTGKYGTATQKGGTASMLRLRMTAGRVTKDKFRFVAEAMEKYGVTKAHFTTCENIQLHDLNGQQLCDIMEEALDADIVTMGAGGDFPRNVMCSPLSGVEQGEYFDVTPWAEATADYLMPFIKLPKMPRKLKVGFSNSPKNVPHATYRDLGFAANPDGTFDVYSAGGLGNNARFGVKVAEQVAPEDVLYYAKAMWLTFCAYGNYENRGKARSRYMQETLGGAEGYRKAFLEKLDEVYASGEDLKIQVEERKITKAGEGILDDPRVIPQKQEGLYAVSWHPIGGCPSADVFIALYKLVADMDQVELRLSGDETAYIINLTAAEAKQVLDVIAEDTAASVFETSVSCIGSGICQIGLRNSQALLKACVAAVKEADIPNGALPQIHISGCPSSCGTHQTGEIGFRGATKRVDEKAQSAFILFVRGCDQQGQERMGEELGTILETQIPAFLVELGQAVQASGTTYETWVETHYEQLKEIAAKYL